MSIKLELEEREWEALVDKLIDSKLREAEPQGMQSCVVGTAGMDAKQAFNFLNDEPISREKDDE